MRNGVPTRRAVFLDKDGALLETTGEVRQSRIRLRPGAVDALLLLTGLGYLPIVVSNQPGVALGRFPHGALAAVEEHLEDLFLAHGFALADCYWCPHHPDGTVADYALSCACRKPMPGLLQAAAAEHGIDLARSWMIGDVRDDVEAGRRAGCRTVLLGGRDEADTLAPPQRVPHVVAGDLLEAAETIMRATAREAVLPPPGTRARPYLAR
jgi:histidinol-phosphate phosphatase family protein